MNIEQAIHALEDEAAEYGKDTPLGALMYECADAICKHADHEWQPIETAPKKELEQIRLWNGHEYVGIWGAYSRVWFEADDGTTLSPQPTHWRPKAKGPC